jgi:hypothetical protein
VFKWAVPSVKYSNVWLNAKNSANMLKYILQAEPENFHYLFVLLTILEYIIKHNLLQVFKIGDTDHLVMQLAVLDTVHSLHPERDWLHIYTDGSLTNRNGNRAGILCKLFRFYLSLEQHGTHLAAETEAIKTALRQLFGGIGPLKGLLYSAI